MSIFIYKFGQKTKYNNTSYFIFVNGKFSIRTQGKDIIIQEEGKGGIVLYQTPDGQTDLEVKLENETVWLTQAQICMLFDKSKGSISEHISNIFREGELVKDSVVREFRTTASDGKAYTTKYYNLVDGIQVCEAAALFRDKSHICNIYLYIPQI